MKNSLKLAFLSLPNSNRNVPPSPNPSIPFLLAFSLTLHTLQAGGYENLLSGTQFGMSFENFLTIRGGNFGVSFALFVTLPPCCSWYCCQCGSCCCCYCHELALKLAHGKGASTTMAPTMAPWASVNYATSDSEGKIANECQVG